MVDRDRTLTSCRRARCRRCTAWAGRRPTYSASICCRGGPPRFVAGCSSLRRSTAICSTASRARAAPRWRAPRGGCSRSRRVTRCPVRASCSKMRPARRWPWRKRPPTGTPSWRRRAIMRRAWSPAIAAAPIASTSSCARSDRQCWTCWSRRPGACATAFAKAPMGTRRASLRRPSSPSSSTTSRPCWDRRSPTRGAPRWCRPAAAASCRWRPATIAWWPRAGRRSRWPAARSTCAPTKRAAPSFACAVSSIGPRWCAATRTSTRCRRPTRRWRSPIARPTTSPKGSTCSSPPTTIR